MTKKIVFSGIQPTGNIHLGNYLGAILNWIEMQDIHRSIFCIVNSHSITTKQDPATLASSTIDLACMLLACGIDHKKCDLFIQSHIDEHPALAWILDCNIPMGDMSRMTQFKDKASRNSKNVNVGLFNYPALMASDILLYQVDFVPVGEDQKQHIELTRNVASRFNKEYGDCFKIPEPIISKTCSKVMGLDNPNIKMSKSIKSKNHAIFLTDSNDAISQKIKKSVTDSNAYIDFDESRAGLYNLLSIYEMLSAESRIDIENRFHDKGYKYFKDSLAELIISKISPIRDRYFRFKNDREYILDILKEGANKVRPMATSTYNRAKELVGLI